RGPAIARGAALVSAAILLGAGPVTTPSPGAASPSSDDTQWAVFDRGAIARAVAAGETVFVDVTAAWCLTCKANKALTLDREPVASALIDPGVMPMRADWTRPDPTIARYLESHDRFGIPFNVVYGPAAPEGLTLPEILTPGAVLDAIEKAGG
ncbi:MAG: thioredoxin family protein, partial [Pseudomonadota bacterium]